MNRTRRPRHQPTKAELAARLIRATKRRLAADQVRDLAMAHNINLDAIAHGQADASILWQWVGGIYTWWRVAELLGQGVPEMQLQIDLATSVVERYGRTGRVGFSGAQLQQARDGVSAMDQLAELVDRPTAIAAAEWSERKVNQLETACAAREAA